MLLAREGSRSIMLKNIDVRIHFSHNFQIDPDILEEYGDSTARICSLIIETRAKNQPGA
jgi:hypothetical protein